MKKRHLKMRNKQAIKALNDLSEDIAIKENDIKTIKDLKWKISLLESKLKSNIEAAINSQAK